MYTLIFIKNDEMLNPFATTYCVEKHILLIQTIERMSVWNVQCLYKTHILLISVQDVYSTDGCMERILLTHTHTLRLIELL